MRIILVFTVLGTSLLDFTKGAQRFIHLEESIPTSDGSECAGPFAGPATWAGPSGCSYYGNKPNSLVMILSATVVVATLALSSLICPSRLIRSCRIIRVNLEQHGGEKVQ